MIQDIKQALRSLRAHPVVSAVAVLSLALGIGVNTTIFSVAERLLLRRLPIPAPEQIVNVVSPGLRPGPVWMGDSGGIEAIFSHPLFRELERFDTRGLTLAAHRDFPVNLGYEGQTGEGEGLLVSGRYFEVLGLSPVLGRLLGPKDDQSGAPPVALLTHRYWSTRLGADTSVLGRTIVVNGEALTVVGVGPEGFTGTTTMDRPDVFVPLSLADRVGRSPLISLSSNNRYWLYLFARLGPAVSSAKAEETLNPPFSAWLRDVAQTLPASVSAEARARFVKQRISLVDGSRGRIAGGTDVRIALSLLFAVTGFVLAIACVNVANLLLTRAADRSTETAVRLSLGASQARLVRLGLAEAGVLGVLGAVAAFAVVQATLLGLTALLPPFPLSFEVNRSALLFSLGLGLGTSMVFGLFPAIHGVRAAVAAGLQTRAGHTPGARSATRVRMTLATGQIALATTLLGIASLLTASLVGLTRVETGMRPAGVVTFRLSPSLNGYTPERSMVLYERVEEMLRGVPGVVSVSAGTIPVLADNHWTDRVRVEGFEAGPAADTTVSVSHIDTGYFQTLGIPLLAGRDIARADGRDSPGVAVVNETFVRRFRLGASAIGTRIAMGEGDGPPDIEVVGLVHDAKYASVRDQPPPQIFFPYRQVETASAGSLTFYVRTTGGSAPLVGVIPDLVGTLDANLPVAELRTLEDQVWQNTTLDRVLALLSSTFAGLAILLAAIGLYAVIAYGVAQRVRELGIRLALGAPRGHVRWLVFSRVLRMGLVGGVIGLTLAFAFGRLGRALLFGVAGYEAAIAGAAALFVLAVALGASVLPAHRATRADPVAALRAE